MGRRGRKPKPVINMSTKKIFPSASAAAAHAGVGLTKMYNHIHMVGASHINGESYCYYKPPSPLLERHK